MIRIGDNSLSPTRMIRIGDNSLSPIRMIWIGDRLTNPNIHIHIHIHTNRDFNNRIYIDNKRQQETGCIDIHSKEMRVIRGWSWLLRTPSKGPHLLSRVCSIDLWCRLVDSWTWILRNLAIFGPCYLHSLVVLLDIVFWTTCVVPYKKLRQKISCVCPIFFSTIYIYIVEDMGVYNRNFQSRRRRMMWIQSSPILWWSNGVLGQCVGWHNWQRRAM